MLLWPEGWQLQLKFLRKKKKREQIQLQASLKGTLKTSNPHLS